MEKIDLSEFWLQHDRMSVEVASKAAAISGAQATWIKDSFGSTLPSELISTGHHIMIAHKGLPKWLQDRMQS